MNLLEFCMWSAAETKSITAEETIKELQQRIDKAIEYINQFKVTHDIDGDIAYVDEFHILASPKKLLEILKGSDKE